MELEKLYLVSPESGDFDQNIVEQDRLIFLLLLRNFRNTTRRPTTVLGGGGLYYVSEMAKQTVSG